MRVQVYIIFIYIMCSLRTTHQNNVFQFYTVRVLQMYFMNLISMLNIAYYLLMNQKHYNSSIMMKIRTRLVLIIDSIHFRFIMEMIIHACGIFKVQLKLVQTSKHDLHYGHYSP